MEHVISSESACCYDNIPLHLAVKEDNAEKLEYLLGQPNIDLNYVDKEVTALYLSLELRRSDSFIIRLIEAGCDPNLTTEDHDSPLHLAVNRLTTKVALKLIEKGADVNAVDDYKQTPLHYAVENNNLESVCMLLYYGANANLEDSYYETPIQIALNYERLEIISVLTSYYDIKDLLTWTVAGRDHLTDVILKLVLDFINAGAIGNCTDHYGYILLEYSLMYSNKELFKLMWWRFDHASLLQCGPFLSHYFKLCKFPLSEWLECLYLILESPNASDCIKHCCIFSILAGLDAKKVECKDRIGLIYLFLSFDSDVMDNDFIKVYEVYGFQEELEALIYCSSRNLNNYVPELWSSDFPLIIKILEGEPGTEDIFKWLKYKIEMSNCYSRKTRMKEIANTLGFFWLPTHVKAKLFDLFEEKCEVWEDISKILNDGVTFPSLRELSRNQTRRYIKENFKIERTYQFYDVLKKLKLPRVVYDIICFKKPIY